ncbi:MAG TPA: porin family protein [Bacteroidales bacterium]|nr:porin family protein [Bacteroidales bacterium]
MKTKKRFLVPVFVFSLCIFGAGKVLPQDGIMERMAFGVKAGVNSSNVYDTKGDDFDAKAKWGFAAGAFLSFPFNAVLGFQPELMYSQKGFKSTGSVLGVDYSYTRKLNYIDVPLQLQIKPIPALTILAGPQFSFLINEGYDFESDAFDLGDQDPADDNARKNTIGIVGGLDLHFSNAVLSGRVAWDMQRNNGDGTSTSPRYRNVVIQLTLGIML